MATSRAQRAATADRRRRAVAMRREHHDWDTIAETLGYASKGAACTDVRRAYEANLADLAQTVDVARQAELEELGALARAAWQVLRTEHLRVADGKVIYHRDEPLLDDGPVLAAIDRLVKIAERRAKLTGADVPVKAEITAEGHVRYSIDGIDLGQLQ